MAFPFQPHSQNQPTLMYQVTASCSRKKGILSVAQASLPPIYLSQLLCSKPVGKGTARRCRDLSSGLPFLTRLTNPTACLTWFSFVHCVSAVSFCSNNYLLGRKGKGECGLSARALGWGVIRNTGLLCWWSLCRLVGYYLFSSERRSLFQGLLS